FALSFPGSSALPVNRYRQCINFPSPIILPFLSFRVHTPLLKSTCPPPLSSQLMDNRQLGASG
ncbi:hypothetical protein AMATHDRAFT_94554, partial [Amanita thiersii Skay4041]